MQVQSRQEIFTTKIQTWLKENISLLAIIIISVVYVLYGLITITETGKTLGQIIADGSVSFLMGYLIKTLLNNQGLVNGEKSEAFLKTKAFYLSLLDEINPYQHFLSGYCEYENELMLRKAQTSILKSHVLKYEDFINNTFDYGKLTKSQKKAIKKARHLKLNYLNEAILLSDYHLSLDVGKDIKINKKTYQKHSNTITLIIMIASGILFGWFSVDKESGFSVAGAIWSLIQIAYYLGIGAVQYFQGYTFMTDTYKTALIRKSNYLEKFRNMYKENPNRFKTDYEFMNTKGGNKEDGDNSRFKKEIPTNGTEQSSRDEQLSKRTEESSIESSKQCPCTEIFKSYS